MNVVVRRLPLLLIPAVLAGLLSAPSSQAQTVATSPVGYVQIACTGSSDTYVSVPFTQPAIFVGTVASVSGSTVTVSGTTGWAANQLVYSGSGTPTYFALMGAASTGTNGREGASYTIASNGTNTLTLALNGDSLSTVPVGSSISVIPYWTIATVFPASNEISVNPSGSFAKSTSPRLNSLKTQILIPDYGGAGINLPFVNTYYFYNGEWLLFGDTNPAHVAGDDVLPNNGYMIIRNAGTPTTTLTAMGSVVVGKVMLPLATQATGGQDNPVSLLRPVDVALNDTGLGGSPAFVTTTSPRLSGLADQILLVSNTSTGINKPISSTYFYYQGHWALFGDPVGPSVDHGADTIPAGTGFVIRKVASGNGATAFWQHSPTY